MEGTQAAEEAVSGCWRHVRLAVKSARNPTKPACTARRPSQPWFHELLKAPISLSKCMYVGNPTSLSAQAVQINLKCLSGIIRIRSAHLDAEGKKYYSFTVTFPFFTNMTYS